MYLLLDRRDWNDHLTVEWTGLQSREADGPGQDLAGDGRSLPPSLRSYQEPVELLLPGARHPCGLQGGRHQADQSGGGPPTKLAEWKRDLQQVLQTR